MQTARKAEARTCADCGAQFKPVRSDGAYCNTCSTPVARKRRSRNEQVSRSSCKHCNSREHLSLLRDKPVCDDCREGIRACRSVRTRVDPIVKKVGRGFAEAYRARDLGSALADADLDHLSPKRLEQLAALLIAEQGPNLEYTVLEVDASGSDVLAPYLDSTRRPQFRWESFADEVDTDDGSCDADAY